MKLKSIGLWVGMTLGLTSFNIFAQQSVFSYEGFLGDNGRPANGTYDFHFSLYDAVTNGNLCTTSLTVIATSVVKGTFSVLLDFGTQTFAGNPRWLEIGVKTNGASGLFTTLNPRQQILPVPYSITAGTANALLGAVSASQVVGSIPSTQISGSLAYTQLPPTIITNAQSTVSLNGVFSGNGAGLTNVSYSVINVRNFGAAGDGLQDDTKAIQSAIDNTKNVGGVIYFPTGRYKVTSTLTLPLNGNITPGGGSLPRYQLSFKGDGQGNSHILMTGSGDLFNGSFNAPKDTVYYDMADHYSFMDLDLVGPGNSSTGAGLHLGLTDEPLDTFTFREGVQWLKVDDCHITGFANGIAVTNCVEMFLNRVFFESNHIASASLKKVDSLSINDCFIGFDWQYGDGANKSRPFEGIILKHSLYCRAVNGTFQSCNRVFYFENVTSANIEGANWEDVFYKSEVILSKYSTINVNGARLGGHPTASDFAFLRADEFNTGNLQNVGSDDNSYPLMICAGKSQPMYMFPSSHSLGFARYSLMGGETNLISTYVGASRVLLAPISWNYLQRSNYIGMTFYNAPSEWNRADAGFYLVRTKLNATNVVVEDMIPSNLLNKDMGVNGVVSATNGIASFCSNLDPAVSCSKTGWTNTWKISAMVYIQGDGFTVNKNKVALFSNVQGGVTVKVQPGEAIKLEGTVTSVHAEPF